MISALHRSALVAGVLGLVAAFGLAANPPPKSADDPKGIPPTREQPAKAPTSKALGDLQLPTGAIFVICDEVKNALGLIPKAILLTPEKYQEMLSRIDQLERQLKPGRPETPSSCRLTGQADGDLARLQAQFQFRTERPRSLVALGCQRAWVKGATLDGHLPLLLPPGDDGWTVQVDPPGVHELTLELEIPVAVKSTKGMDRGFDMGLPRAAITNLEQFQLPTVVAEVRVNGRSVRAKPADAQHSQLESVSLGAAERLELIWKGPAPTAPNGPPLAAVEGRWNVRLEETRVTTEATLNLQVLRGEMREWKIQLPPQALLDVKEPREEDERIDKIELPSPKNPLLIVRLKEASADPLRLVLHLRQPRPKGLIPVGPIAVQDTFRQWGTILVAAPPEWRLRVHPHGELSQQEIPDDLGRKDVVALFSYWNLSAPTNAAQPLAAPLELEAESMKGAVETRVSHTLRLGDLGWRVTTKIEVSPFRTAVDHLPVHLPASYQLDQETGAFPAELVEEVGPADPQTRVAQVKLAEKRGKPFTVTLVGTYPLQPGRHTMNLDLPRPVQTQDRGGQVTVSVPEGFDLVSSGSPTPLMAGDKREHTWHTERAPTNIALAWKPQQADLAANSVVDITMLDYLAFVRHRLHLQAPQTLPAQLSLKVPPSLAGKFRIEGGTLDDRGNVTLNRPAAKEATLILTYSFLLPAAEVATTALEGPTKSRRFSVPLVRPEQVSRADAKVRVWTEPGVQPALAEGPWEEQPTETVADKDSLPALVLTGASPSLPLSLRLVEPAVPLLATVMIDRALIQASVSDGGHQTYRARFLVNRLNTRHLDLAFPGRVSQLNLEVLLDGKKVTRLETSVRGGNKLLEDNRVVRLDIEPDLYHKPVILDIRYQLTGGHSASGAWYTTLQPPEFRGNVFMGRVRWQVTLFPHWVALYLGDGFPLEQQWVWKGGLLMPKPALSRVALEEWFLAPLAGPAAGADALAAAEEGEATLVCSRAGLGPLQVMHVSRQIWLLVCSLVFLLLGLSLGFAPIGRGLLGVLVGILAVVLLNAAIWWPTLLPVIVYGCEPGAGVLVLLLVGQWMLHRRYRRQVVFLPGFTRLKAGSSLARQGIANRQRNEPSTVDAPPAPAGTEAPA